MSDHVKRLKLYLTSRNQPHEFESLTADASTREYFRIGWNGKSAVACLYPDPFDPAKQSYLDVTQLFIAAGLPVADVFDVDGDLGVIVQEDLGDRILRNEMIDGKRDRDYSVDEAIKLIVRIQAATAKAYEINSVASRLRFDTEKLSWELGYFKTHYFETFLKQPLAQSDDESLTAEFLELSRELETHAAVICHRDFHAANLMVDPQGRLRIIDHQDARIGSVAYDLVSLLLDRVTEPPPDDWLVVKRRIFLRQREEMGIEKIDAAAFDSEFKLQTIQRCLKAAGTFSYQAAERGKTHFIPFIKPMFRISLTAANDLERFPAVRKILEREITRESDPTAIP